MSEKLGSPSVPRESEVEELRLAVQRFVRGFGLLVTRRTPCGKPISISYAHALMVLLARGRDHCVTSHADLSAVLGIDKSNVARLCERMGSAGHVDQVTAPNDGRSRLVTLTPAGVRLARTVDQGSRDRFTKIATSMPASKRPRVLAALAELNAAVESLDELEES